MSRRHLLLPTWKMQSKRNLLIDCRMESTLISIIIMQMYSHSLMGQVFNKVMRINQIEDPDKVEQE